MDEEVSHKQSASTDQTNKVRTYAKGPLKGLNSNVTVLGLISLLADISSEMLYPIIPIFLTSVLGAPISVVGFIEGTAEAIASLLKTYVGKLSDSLGRRRSFVFFGYTLSACARPLFALAGNWYFVLFSRSLDRLGKGIRTSPRDAMLAESVDSRYRGKAFGLHRGMDTLGAVVGPLVALAFLSLNWIDLRWIFILSFFPALASALLVLKIKETAPTKLSKDLLSAKTHSPLPKTFKLYLLGWGIFCIANSSDMFLILRAKELGFTTSTVILLYTFYNFVYALASPFLGDISDKIGRKPILISGLFLFALVYLGFAFSTHTWMLWILFGIYGLYMAATDGVGKALAIDLVDTKAKATAIGYLGTVTGIASLAASSLAGLFWSHYGSWTTFSYGALGAIVSGCVILLTPTNKHS